MENRVVGNSVIYITGLLVPAKDLPPGYNGPMLRKNELPSLCKALIGTEVRVGDDIVGFISQGHVNEDGHVQVIAGVWCTEEVLKSYPGLSLKLSVVMEADTLVVTRIMEPRVLLCKDMDYWKDISTKHHKV